jgi:hypothetical protein
MGLVKEAMRVLNDKLGTLTAKEKMFDEKVSQMEKELDRLRAQKAIQV